MSRFCPALNGCNSLFLSAQSPGSAANDIFAKLEVYLWLGLAKYSKEATNNLPEEFSPIFEEEEEEEEEQKRLMPPGIRKLPVHLACQGMSDDLIKVTTFFSGLADGHQPNLASLLLQTASISSCDVTCIRGVA